MKVVCIDNEWDDVPGYAKAYGYPVFGCIYTVVRSICDEDGNWYQLAEFHYQDYFQQEGFIPVSEIDETTFERNYKTEAV